MAFAAVWHHDLNPFIYQFSDTWGIRWYGLAYVAGFLAGAWLLRLYYQKGRSQLDTDQQGDLFFALIAGVILGGRLGYFLFYARDSLAQDPLVIFKINQGGMASHGGMIGVAVAAWIMSRKLKLPFLRLSDLLVTLSPPGILFGRLANFQNGELWGKPTNGEWGVVFPDAPDALARHPSQLYQAGLEGLALLLYTQWRLWKSPILKERPGQLAGEFLVGYAIARVIGEQFREPDVGVPLLFGVLSRGSVLSIVFGVAGLGLILYARRRAAPSR